MQFNRLGKTELQVSPIGFGGIVVMKADPSDAQRIVADAVEYGINYFDVAPGYEDAEVKLGPALKPFRKDVYLACKTHCRDAEGARVDLANSMERLRTDYFDVYQLHGIVDVEKDVKAAFARGGAMEVILEARDAGIIRNIGFSAHSEEAALAAMNEFDFDTVMFPVNFTMHLKKNFEVRVIDEAKKRDMGIIALKTLARQKRVDQEVRPDYEKCWYEPIPVEDADMAELALSWTLAQGVSVAISPGEERLLRVMMEALPNVRELDEGETGKLSDYLCTSEAFL